MDMRLLEHPDITYCNIYGYPPGRDRLPETDTVCCDYCDKVFSRDDEDCKVYGGYCHDCAEAEFNLDTGLHYLKHFNLEEEFFLETMGPISIYFKKNG